MFVGSIPAVITPFKNHEVDYISFEKIINHLVINGSNSLVPCGTTGESPTLSHEEHKKIIEESIRITDKRVPIIAGTGSNNTAEAIDFTKHAENSGADAALVVTPYYNKPTQRGLFQHFSEIARSVELPQILYNVPSRTGCDLLPETIAHLNESDLVIGIKEATGDLERAKAIMSASDIKVYSGDDETSCDLMLMGGSGTISVTANVAPMRVAKMSEAALSGNFELAKNLDSQLRGLHRDLFLESNPIPVKWALYEMGKIENGIRLPMTELAPEHHRLLRESLLQAGAI